MDVPECPGCRALLARLAEAEAKILALEGQLRDLLNKLKPPAAKAATPQPPAPAKKPTGKKPGGQPGHPPTMKALVPPERVNHVVPYIPDRCGKCDEPLSKKAGPNDPEPKRHQVAELPKVAAEITEHQGHARTCPCCGEVTWATIPADVRAHSVGPKLTAAMGYFVANHGVSKRGAEEIVEHVFETSIALGTIANLEQELSGLGAGSRGSAASDRGGGREVHRRNRLEKERQEAVAVGQCDGDDRLFCDPCPTQSGRVEARRRRETHRHHEQRPVVRVRRLAGVAAIVLGSCEAELGEADRRGGSAAKRLGEAWLDGHRQVFELWHLFRGGGCTRKELDEQMKPLFVKLNDVLGQGRRTRAVKFARFCTRLTTDFPHLWTFVTHEGVEPTNNHAERVLRRAVLWRRRSFGCHSDAGCRFVERILTVVQSLRQQKRSVLEFLGETIKTHRAGKATPRLLIG